MSPYNKKLPISVTENFRISVEEIVNKFRQDPSEVEYVFPSTLSNVERAFIHELVKTHGLQSRSYGKEPNRCLKIFKKNKFSSVNESIIELSGHGLNNVKRLLKDFPLTIEEISDDACDVHSRDVHENPQNMVLNKTMGKLHDAFPLLPPEPLTTVYDYTKQELPIWCFRDKIINTISSNQVTLICGETGSGKTTQVPQYILEDSRIRNVPCRVVCTQPRRLSAVSVAERVACERGETLGTTVGYQIRLESRVSPRTILTYCTNGVLLRTLMSGNSYLNTVTHIVVDEIHERDRFSDFLLICLKQCLLQNKQLKIILMSATMDTRLFIDYFNNPPVLIIPGRQFPVTEYFLEDVLSTIEYSTPEIRKYERLHPKQNSSQQKLSHESLNSQRPILGRIQNEDEENFEIGAQPSVVMDQYITDCFLGGTPDAFSQFVHVILSEGANIDYQHSVTGVTCLIAAAAHGNITCVEQLLNLGASVHLESTNGMTALNWSVKHGNTEITELLTAFIGVKSNPNESDCNSVQLCEEMEHRLTAYHNTVSDEHIDYDLALELIVYVHTKMQPGSILFFLPGYDDIVSIKERIIDDDRLTGYVLFTLHSSMQTLDQKQVFRPATNGQRKIILSTNVAETSITIQDVVYVLDSGKVKEKNFDAVSNVSCLMTAWVSQACASQRAGRAGRTAPGVCYHLFSRRRYASLQSYPTPEILRMPLHELCLQTKLLAPSDISIDKFLSLAIEPPSPLVTRNAIQSLKTLGALDSNEQLTPLGHHLVELAVEPHLAKILLYGILLKCIDPVLTIVCCLSYRDPFVLPSQASQRRAAITSRKRLASDTYSDHMVLLRVFQEWQACHKRSAVKDYCDRNFVSGATMEMIVGMRAQILGQLRAAGFVKSRPPADIKDLNQNSENWAVVKAALSAGLYPNLVNVDSHAKQLQTQGESKVLLHPSSVLRDLKPNARSISNAHAACVSELPSDWIVFDEMSRAGRLCLVKGATVVTPLTVFLMAGPSQLAPESIKKHTIDDNNYMMTVQLDKWIKFAFDNELQVDNLIAARRKWYALIRRKMKQPNNFKNSRNDARVLDTIVALLSEEESKYCLPQPSGVGQKPLLQMIDCGAINKRKSTNFKSQDTSKFQRDIQQFVNSNLQVGALPKQPTFSSNRSRGMFSPEQKSDSSQSQQRNMEYFANDSGIFETPKFSLERYSYASESIVNSQEAQSRSNSLDSLMNPVRSSANKSDSFNPEMIDKNYRPDCSNVEPQNKLMQALRNPCSVNDFENCFSALSIQENNNARQLKSQLYEFNYGQGNAAYSENIANDFASNGVTISDDGDILTDRSPIRYFVIKANSLHVLDISINKKTWRFTPHVQEHLLNRLAEGYAIILIFTVMGSGHFQGIAQLLAGPQRSASQRNQFCPIRWISCANVPFVHTRHLLNSYNSGRRVYLCSDGQELEPVVGASLCEMFTTMPPQAPQLIEPSCSPPKYGRPIRGSTKYKH